MWVFRLIVISRACMLFSLEIKVTLSDEEILVRDYLKATGFDGIQEWALDCGYCYNDDYDVWYDDDGEPVELQERLLLSLGSLS
jgi:hypothetical protein